MAIETKNQARKAFGVPYKAIAKECGIAISTFNSWGETFTKAQSNMLEGALLERKRRRLRELLVDDDLKEDE